MTSGSFSSNSGAAHPATAKLIQKVEEGIYESKGQVSPHCKNNVPTSETNSSTMPLPQDNLQVSNSGTGLYENSSIFLGVY